MAGTTNYNLTKPGDNEYYDIAGYNTTLEIIDSALHDLETGKATPQDITTAFTSKLTPIQIYNITSANYADNKYEITLPYDRCYFMLAGKLRNTKRDDVDGCRAFGIITKSGNGVMSIGTGITYGANNYNNHSLPLVAEIANNGFIIATVSVSDDVYSNPLLYLAQVVDGKLKLGTGNLTTASLGTNDRTTNFAGTIALMQI